MHPRRCTASVIAILLASGGWAAENDEQARFQLESQVLCRSDRALIVLLDVTAPRHRDVVASRIEFRWSDELQVRHTCGLRDRQRGESRVRILLAAQLVGSDTTEAVLAWTVSQISGRRSNDSWSWHVAGGQTVSHWVAIDVPAGSYALDRPLRIGQLNGRPIWLTVGKAAR